jgi:integrase
MSRKRRDYRLFRRREIWHFDTWIDGDRFRGSTGQRNNRAAHQEARRKIEVETVRRRAGQDEAIAKVFALMVVEKRKKKQREGYIRKVIQHGRDFIIEHFGADRLIGTIEDMELEEFKSHLLNMVGDLETANRILTSLRQMFKFAESRGICRAPRLPRNHPTCLQEKIERWQILPPEEVARVLTLVPEEARPALVYLANIGGRTSMAPAVHRTMCDFTNPDRPRVHYPASVMKGRKKLTVDLNESALHALELGLALHGDRPFPLPDWKLRKLWNKAREAADYPTLRIHDLRHSRISFLLEDNPPHVVRDMVGHCSLVVTNLYAHSTDEARCKAARSVEVKVDLETSIFRTDTISGTNEGSDGEEE